jgi:hypothetical protein
VVDGFPSDSGVFIGQARRAQFKGGVELLGDGIVSVRGEMTRLAGDSHLKMGLNR